MYIRITAYDVLGEVHLQAVGLGLDTQGQPTALWTRSATFPLSRHQSLEKADGLGCVAEELTNMAYSDVPWDTMDEHR